MRPNSWRKKDALRWICFSSSFHTFINGILTPIIGGISRCVFLSSIFLRQKWKWMLNFMKRAVVLGCIVKNQWTMFSGQITPFPSPGFRVCEWENFFFGCILRTQINQLQLVINDDSHKMKHFVFSLSTVNTLTCEINIYLRWQSVCSFITARGFFCHKNLKWQTFFTLSSASQFGLAIKWNKIFVGNWV